MDRRNYLKLIGGVGILSGFTGGAVRLATVTEGGPENPDEWRLAFEDTFDSGSLDTSKWMLGFGWGNDGAGGRVSADQVAVRDGKLHLSTTHDGDGTIYTSVLNTSDTFWIGSGSYWEAKIDLPSRVGLLPAFWAKALPVTYWPEIDFIELFQDDGDRLDTHRANYHVHYSTSTIPSDWTTRTSIGVWLDSPVDLTDEYHVYAGKWMDDRVDFFLDGIYVDSVTEPVAMEALRKGGPQYAVLSNMVDVVGETDRSHAWTEETVVDWVRIWQHAPDSAT